MPEHFKDSAAASPDNPTLQGSSTSNAAAPNAGDTVAQKKRRPRHRPRKDNQQAAGLSGGVPETGEVADGVGGPGQGDGQAQRSKSRQRNRPNKRERAAARERAMGDQEQQTEYNAQPPVESSSQSGGQHAHNGRQLDDRGPNVGPSRGGGRRRQINAKLTEADSPASRATRGERQQRSSRPVPPKEDTLTNRLIHSLRTPPYADCPICFNAIFPGQPTWSCSPSSEGIGMSTTLHNVLNAQCVYIRGRFRVCH